MFIVVIIFLLLILSATSYYLSKRTHCGLTSFFPKVRLWPILLFVTALILMLLLGFARSTLPFSDGWKDAFGLIGGYSMGILLYYLLFTVAADLLLLIPRRLKCSFTQGRFFNGIITICIVLITLITGVYGFFHAQQVTHVSYKVELKEKNDISDLNLVMVSDLHLGAIGSESRLEKIVAEINELEPDLLCIAGDFFDTDFTAIQKPDAAIQTLQKLKTTYGTYACLGNHDGGETHRQMLSFLKKAGITVLADEYTVIDDRFVLAGRPDKSPIGGYDEKQRKELSEVLNIQDSSLPVIMLDHNPANIEEYSDQVDLILSGHTHKGQVFPANLFTNLIYTVDYGYYNESADHPQVIVTSGIGYWGMPMRVGTDCEIVSIRFYCK